MTKTFYGILFGIVLCVLFTLPVLADELKVTVNVEKSNVETQILGADIYANIDGKLTEITVAPDDMAFKMNLKAGALRIKSFFLPNKKINK